MGSIVRVHASIFDLHLWKSPLLDAQAMSTALAPLANPTGTGNAATGTDLPQLRAFPLSYQPDRHRFWRRYSDFVDGAPKDIRHRLLPLRCRPKDFELTFVGGISKPVAVFATIWLWPFGWASSLEFSVRESLSLDDVQKVNQALRGKAAKPAFLLNKAPTTLPQVFDNLSQRILKDTPAQGSNARADLVVSKHIVLSLVPSKDTPQQRYGAEPATMPQWSDANRGRLHACLLGNDVSIAEVLKREREGAFMLTPLGGGSFGLTYFEEGTLLVWGSSWRETGRCFARNVANVSLAALALQGFVDRQPRLTGDSAAIKALADAVTSLLADLRTGYRNSFSHRFLKLNAAVNPKARP